MQKKMKISICQKRINKIKDQIQGLDITDQNSFDKVDTVSGATTSASAIKKQLWNL